MVVRSISGSDIICEECGEHPRITEATYDGIKVKCGCDGYVVIPYQTFKDNAPKDWVYESRRVKNHLNGKNYFDSEEEIENE
jgi:hypothetical protein